MTKKIIHHCWHDNGIVNICCSCDKRTKGKGRNYYTKDGLIDITCELSKTSLMWAEGYRPKRTLKNERDD
jgi:hypothetical protein